MAIPHKPPNTPSMKISAIASSVHHWIRPHVITRSKMEKLTLAEVIRGKSGRDTASSKTVDKLKEMFNVRSGIPYKSSSNLRYTPLELGASHRDVGSHERRIPLNYMRTELEQAFSALEKTDLGYTAKATLLSNLHMFQKQLNSAETCWKDHLAANADRSDPKQAEAAQLAREWLSGSQVGTLSAEVPVDQALNPSLAHAHADPVSTPKDPGAGELRRTPIAVSGEDTGVDPNVHSQQDELDRYLAERVAKYEGLTSHEDTTRVATLPPMSARDKRIAAGKNPYDSDSESDSEDDVVSGGHLQRKLDSRWLDASGADIADQLPPPKEMAPPAPWRADFSQAEGRVPANNERPAASDQEPAPSAGKFNRKALVDMMR